MSIRTHDVDTPTPKDLRQFGLIVGGIFGLIAFWPLVVREEAIRLWALAASGALMVPALLAPKVLRPVHHVWMKVGHVLGWINTRILLGIVFYGIVTPLGVLSRLIGKDSLGLRTGTQTETYRRIKTARPVSHMRYPF